MRALALLLSHYDFFSLSEKYLILEQAKDIQTFLKMRPIEIASLIKRDFKIDKLNFQSIEKRLEKTIALMRAYSIGLVFYDEEAYPPLLKEIHDPPFALFYRGEASLLHSLCLGIVGTRRPTGRGMKASFDIAKSLAENALTIVSGLARGIDGYAHKGALEAKDGKTIAVLASGLDSIYPSDHKRLALQMLERGSLLLSEHPPLTPALTWHFPKRNRIIAGLSEGVLVVEAPRGSGSLITASCAIEENRELFFHELALQYSFQKLALSASDKRKLQKKWAVQNYIDDGALLISSAKDIIQHLSEGSIKNTSLLFSQYKLDLN